ncbi:MAG: gliding motility protein GldM [Tannerella sp.]|jgi:gliding motility-associated protein GldM|nr:gliding motility protein GldM [Tannerella sp.]
MAGVSNPNSARQKMINLMYLVFIAMMALQIPKEVIDSFELVEGGLNKTIEDVSSRNKFIMNQLDLYRRENESKAGDWYQYGVAVKNRSDSLFNYIHELKLNIVKEADGKDGSLDNIKNKEHLDVASIVMLNPMDRKGRKLRESVEAYRDELIRLVQDPAQKKMIASLLDLQIPKGNKLASKDWETAMFDKMPVAAAITLLTKLQADIRSVEGEALSSLLRSIDVGDYRVNDIRAMVIPQSQIVMRGTPYKAQIVLAAVDSTKRPDIYIGNKKLESADGMYVGGSGTIGPQTFSGYIELPQPDGAPKQYPFAETYYVTEQVATIAPTMMNILYESIDNDMKIAIPGVPSGSIRAGISAGSITQKSGNVWTARPPANATSVNITLTASVAGGSSISMSEEFRVRPLPPPQPYIAYRDASGTMRKFTGGTIAKRSLIEAEGVQAAIDDGILDIQFNVTSFELTFYDSMGNAIPEISQSGRFTDRQKEMIRNLARGKRFYITRGKATGPAGKSENLTTIEVIVN